MTQETYKADWQDCLCDDLRPVMQYLQENYRVTGWRADADIQQRWSRIYLNRNPSRKIFLKVKDQFANSPPISFPDQEIRCAAHQVRLLPRRKWDFEYGINRQSTPSFLLEMALGLLLMVGGFFTVYNGTREKNTWDIFVGIASILLFGLSFGLNIRALIRHFRRKKGNGAPPNI